MVRMRVEYIVCSILESVLLQFYKRFHFRRVCFQLIDFLLDSLMISFYRDLPHLTIDNQW